MPYVDLLESEHVTTAKGRITDEVCKRLLTSHDYDGLSEQPKELAEEALNAFVQAGLLDFEFLRNGTIKPGEMVELIDIAQVLASNSHTLMSIFMINCVFGATVIALHGSTDQKNTILPDIVNGNSQMAFALTEPEAGSDAAGISTTYQRTEEGYLLNGEKIFTTGAEIADYLLIVARDGQEGAGKKAVSIFAVPGTSTGLTIEPLSKLAGDNHAACRVLLHRVTVPEAAVVGGAVAEGNGWLILRQMGLLERLFVAAVSVGLGSAIVDRTIGYAKDRRQFGQTIVSFQTIQYTLVDMVTTLTTMRLLLQKACSQVEASVDATAAVSTAKYYCAEKLQELVAAGMRIMGGRAYFAFEPMSRYYREAPWVLYAGGTVEIQKRLVARALSLEAAPVEKNRQGMMCPVSGKESNREPLAYPGRTIQEDRMEKTLQVGIRYEHTFTVSDAQTVPALYPEAEELLVMPQVFATGFLIGFIEWACIKAIRPYLDWPRQQTVGTHVEISHEAATPPGFDVTATVELIAVAGKKLTFAIEVRDETDRIAKGRHERYIIDKEKFDARIAAKISKLAREAKT